MALFPGNGGLDIIYTSLFAQNEQHIKKNNKKAATNNKADRH